MKNLILKIKSLSFKEKTFYTSLFSVILNALIGVFEIILSIRYGVFFLVTGIQNICLMLARLECLLGMKEYKKRSLKLRTFLIGTFLIIAGLEYAIYMSRMVFSDVEIAEYGMILGITIACVSFFQMFLAIRGLFISYGKGHYVRDLKLINLCTALTAIVLTEVAITSFASETSTRIIDGIFGMSVGAIIVIIGLFIWIAPKISIVGREYNVYKTNSFNNVLNEKEVNIVLIKSNLYGDYYYKGTTNGKYIKGNISKGKTRIFKLNIFVLIIVFILSEILIFPYFFGWLIHYFRSSTLIKKLDSKMKEIDYYRVVRKD